MGYKFETTATVHFSKGLLAGLTVPLGFVVPEVDLAHARRRVASLRRANLEPRDGKTYSDIRISPRDV